MKKDARNIVRRSVQFVLAMFLSGWLLAPTLAAQNQSASARESVGGKIPYGAFYVDFEGDAFLHHSSFATPPTQYCNGVITSATTGCSEQFSNTKSGGFAMGIRPIRYLQIDVVNLNILGGFNGLGNRTSTFQCTSGCTGTTALSIGTTNVLVTTGGRLVLPLFKERLLLSAGGGFADLTSFEHPNTTGNTQATCISCQSVKGHGPTEIAEIMYFPGKHMGIGFHVRNVQISSSGLTPDGIFSNSFFGTHYTDRFWLIGGVISFRGWQRR
jgi:hypothetical protein